MKLILVFPLILLVCIIGFLLMMALAVFDPSPEQKRFERVKDAHTHCQGCGHKLHPPLEVDVCQFCLAW